MMNIVQVLCLFCISVPLVKSASVAAVEKQISYYDAIVAKCPSLKADANYTHHPLFQSCNDWNQIVSTRTIITKVTSRIDVQCLLYFYSFTKYCESQGDKGIDIKIESSKLKSYKFEEICDKKDILPELRPTILYKFLANETTCREICGDEIGYVASLCSLAHYYKHLTAVVKPPPSEPIDHYIHVPAQNTPADAKKILPASVNNEGSSKIKTVQKPIKTDAEQGNGEDTSPANPVEKNSAELQPVKVEVPHKQEENPEVLPQPSKDAKQEEKPEVLPQPSKNAQAVQHPDKNKAAAEPAKTVEVKSDIKPKTVDGDAKPAEAAVLDTPNQKADADLIDGGPAPNNEGLPGSEEEFAEGGDASEPEQPPVIPKNEKLLKPPKTDDDDSNTANYSGDMEGDSYFFTYFMLLCIFFVVGYVCYHNKQRILALILEGRRGKRQYRGRRPNSANYHKLDSNLEEAINSTVNKNTSNVIY